MNNQLIELERKAIRFIRNAERLALRMDERGFHVAFSGGKDSQVLLVHLSKWRVSSIMRKCKSQPLILQT